MGEYGQRPHAIRNIPQRRCADVLRSEGFDLIEILTNSDNATFDHISNCVDGIVAVEVGLTDVLAHLGITPSGIVGHSFCGLACAYADGCLTAEQTVLAAFWQNRINSTTALKQNDMMASIGLSWEETKVSLCIFNVRYSSTKAVISIVLQVRLPNDIFPACHNGNDSVTVSGPSNSVKKFIEKLTKEGISAKADQSCGYAFHSKNVADVAPKMLNALEKIIPRPKTRTVHHAGSVSLMALENSKYAKVAH